ncbi:MAG: hypothetical protein ACRD5H_02215 [Nitrososphaerales archaeon]
MQKVDLFPDSIRSPATRRQYTTTLKTFLRDTKTKDLREIDPKTLQSKLIEYVVWLKREARDGVRSTLRLTAPG